MQSSDVKVVEWLAEAIRLLPEDPVIMPRGTRLQRIVDSQPGWYVAIGPKQASLSLVIAKDGHRLHEHVTIPKADFAHDRIERWLLVLVKDMFGSDLSARVPQDRLDAGAKKLVELLGSKWPSLCARICTASDDRSRAIVLAEKSLRDPMEKVLLRVEPFLTEEQWVELVTRVARVLYKHAVVDAVEKL